MILGKDYILRPVTWDEPRPIDKAKRDYIDKSRVPFEVDLAEYLRNGIVISNPVCFGMAKIIDLAPSTEQKPELAWFIRYACGNLAQLLSALPAYLPEITFCRRQDGKLRKWPLKRMMALAQAMQKKEEN